jgi:hypothetical protein
MQRRGFLGGASTVAVAATAGCLGVLTGDEALRREATLAEVPSSVHEDAGYDLEGTDSQTISRTFDTPVGERDVEAVNQMAEYSRSVQLGTESVRAAVFATLSTPAFQFGDRTFNPVGKMSNREIAGMAQEQYSALSVGSEVDRQSVETLDGTMDVSKFEGSGTVAGVDVDTFVHVGKLKHQSDFVLALAVYPRQLSGEGETVLGMVGALSHG